MLTVEQQENLLKMNGTWKSDNGTILFKSEYSNQFYFYNESTEIQNLISGVDFVFENLYVKITTLNNEPRQGNNYSALFKKYTSKLKVKHNLNEHSTENYILKLSENDYCIDLIYFSDCVTLETFRKVKQADK